MSNASPALTACPSCQTLNPQMAKFCGSCGSLLSSTVHTQSIPEQSHNTNRPNSNVIGSSGMDMSTLAIGLAVIGCFMCGPFTTIPGVMLALKDKAEKQKAGLSTDWASKAIWANIIATFASIAISVVMFVMLMLMRMM